MFEVIVLLFFLVGTIATLIAGIVIIKLSKNADKKALNKYRYKVNARIVGKQKVNSDYKDQNSMDVYSSVYEYMYAGKYLRAVSKFGSSHNSDQIGTIKTIYVDPNNPEDIYEPGLFKTLSTIGLIIGILFIIASAVTFIFGLNLSIIFKEFWLAESTESNMVDDSAVDSVTNIVIGVVLGEMVFKILIVVVSFAIAYFVYRSLKKKKERCRTETHADIVDNLAGYGVSRVGTASKVLEYYYAGQIYRKSLPEILCFVISKIKPKGFNIYIDHKNPTDVYHPIVRKVAITIITVVISLITVFIFGSLMSTFADVRDLYGFY